MSLKTQIKTQKIQKFQVKIEWKTLIYSPKKKKKEKQSHKYLKRYNTNTS